MGQHRLGTWPHSKLCRCPDKQDQQKPCLPETYVLMGEDSIIEHIFKILPNVMAAGLVKDKPAKEMERELGVEVGLCSRR